MNTSHTTIFELLYLHPNQSQKELLINNVFAKIDLLLNFSAVSRTVKEGGDPIIMNMRIYIIPQGATGFWQDIAANNIVLSLHGNWNIIKPREGMIVWIEDETKLCVYSKERWQVLLSL